MTGSHSTLNLALGASVLAACGGAGPSAGTFPPRQPPRTAATVAAYVDDMPAGESDPTLARDFAVRAGARGFTYSLPGGAVATFTWN